MIEGFYMNNNQIINTAMRIGSLMLSYGAEIYRAEDSIIRICKAYDAESVEVFAIPSSIIVTLYMNEDEPITLTKSIKDEGTDLDKVDQLNNLSRYICSSTPDYQQIKTMINDIVIRKPYKNISHIIAFAIAPAIFCLFFGGNLKDAFFSMFIGIVVKYLLDILQRLRANLIFTNIICSAVSSVMAILFTLVGLADNYDKMIIGAIMLLVPGLVLTNAMRDFMLGDLIAGMLRLIETLLIAAGIAIGVALVLTLFRINNIF